MTDKRKSVLGLSILAILILVMVVGAVTAPPEEAESPPKVAESEPASDARAEPKQEPRKQEAKQEPRKDLYHRAHLKAARELPAYESMAAVEQDAVCALGHLAETRAGASMLAEARFPLMRITVYL